MTEDQPIAFQGAEGGCQHLLAGTWYELPQVTVALLAVLKGKHHQSDPLAADGLQQLPGRAKVQGRVVVLPGFLAFLFSVRVISPILSSSSGLLGTVYLGGPLTAGGGTVS